MRVLLIVVLCSLSAKAGFAFDEHVTCKCPPLASDSENGQEFSINDRLIAIENQLKTLLKMVQNKLPCDGGYSVSDIAKAIRGKQFQVAEQQLMALADNGKIPQIVHEAYDDSPANSDIILAFAMELTDSEAKFSVFDALSDEMHSTGHNDPLKMISVVEAVEEELSREKNPSAGIKAKAKGVIDRAIYDIELVSTNILRNAMIADTYQKNVEIENLLSALFQFRTEVSNKIIEKLVDSVFGVVAADKVLANIESHKHIPLIVTGLTAVYYRFNFAGNLDSDAMLSLASHLQKLLQREDYKTADQRLKTEVEGIIERIPTCARNLYFHTNICIWNKGRGEYIYAADLASSYDNERRSIYSWYKRNILPGSLWDVEKIGDYYFFKNHHYPNEYLYSVDGGGYNNDMRYVFTWIPGNNTDSQSRWKIELEGDYCYLKSAFNNEYLFATSIKYNQFNYYVFTWKIKSLVRSPESQWQLRDCSPRDIFK